MGCDWYLAMTAAEMLGYTGKEKAAWMACHFSPYSTGLSNLPQALPADSMVILDDSTPFAGHDPHRIAHQLAGITNMGSLLLDLQRPDQQGISELIRVIGQALPCPMAVTEEYAQGSDCAVFLSPPLNKPFTDVIRPWQGREVWLDIPFGCQSFTVTKEGCHISPIAPSEDNEYPHRDEALHCSYHIKLSQDHARFTLYRSPAEAAAILQEAAQLGIGKAISLYQEYNE